jgi:hypothetical protein
MEQFNLISPTQDKFFLNMMKNRTRVSKHQKLYIDSKKKKYISKPNLIKRTNRKDLRNLLKINHLVAQCADRMLAFRKHGVDNCYGILSNSDLKQYALSLHKTNALFDHLSFGDFFDKVNQNFKKRKKHQLVEIGVSLEA